jgi:hypothetical protein
VEGGKPADAQGDLTELVEGDVQVADGAGDGVEWECGELVVRELQDRENGGPLWDVGDILQLVVGEIQLLQTGQLQQRAGDLFQVVVLEIQLDYLQEVCREYKWKCTYKQYIVTLKNS